MANEFGELIKEKRERKGLSGYQIAKNLGIPPQFYYNCEKGYKFPPGRIIELFKILNPNNDEKKELIKAYSRDFMKPMAPLFEFLDTGKIPDQLKKKTKITKLKPKIIIKKRK